MNLLLDTQVLIWWLEDSPRLGKTARQHIRSAHAKVISAASAWEISIKMAVGRLQLTEEPEESIPVLMTMGFQPISIQFRHVLAIRHLPNHHSDPFDRILVAQAQCEGFTLLTADLKLRAYDVPILDAST